MFRNVVAALNESLDITMHLRPLAGHYEVQGLQKCSIVTEFQIQTLEAADFADVRPLFAPLMHTVKKRRKDISSSTLVSRCVWSTAAPSSTTQRTGSSY